MKLALRYASPDDAQRLGALHAWAWHETYAGILPDEMRSKLNAEGRAAMWPKILSDQSDPTAAAVWVAEDDGNVVGFGSCVRQRDQNLHEKGFDAEISAIYVLRSYQGADLGRALIGAMASTLRDRAHHAATLWVLKENAPARRFYEWRGGAVVAEKEEVRPDATFMEVTYVWHDLTPLVG